MGDCRLHGWPSRHRRHTEGVFANRSRCGDEKTPSARFATMSQMEQIARQRHSVYRRRVGPLDCERTKAADRRLMQWCKPFHLMQLAVVDW